MQSNSSQSAAQVGNAAEGIFFAAIDLPIGQRDQFILERCADNTGLKSEVEKLLQGYSDNENSDFILDHPPASVSDHGSATTLAGESAAEKVGDTIGRYRLLEKIGEGGMGVVYMAEQVEGVRRRVALKIIKLGMDTRQVIARFEAERQAMAMFDHPNITRVFDVGATHHGRPFFVMELVKGVGLIEYVNQNEMPLNEKLSLFVSVCNAVQHAHQKGIIHRDLKPSNILVTFFDGVPVPKVIDFGIAKAIGHQLTDKTLFTRYSAMIGTPQYMSPEQAEMTGLDVDTRSDIYSLGVLLYELVTGSTPLSKEKLKKLNPLALYETLREAEIETPSTRIAKTHETNIKNAAGPTPTSKVDRIKGDLDWVIMKALARDRTIRYASVNELGADVDRYLDGEPVLAAPPSKIYRMKSYLRKHLAASIMASVIGLTLLTATIVCSVFAINARKSANNLSEANRELFVTNETLSQNVEKLKTAETELQRVAQEKEYAFAEEIAVEQFSSEFAQVIFELSETMFPQQSPFGELEVEELSAEAVRQSLEDFQPVPICYDYDKNDLWNIEYKDLLSHSVARLEKRHADREKFDARVYEQYSNAMLAEIEVMNQEGAQGIIFPGVWAPPFVGNLMEALESHNGIIALGGEHEHSEECLALHKKLSEVIVQHRPKFYRYLVQEYRRSFGDNDKRVAEGLNMWAASLLEINKLNEAEAHLRQSIMLGEGRDKNAAQFLLSEVQRLRKRPAKISVPGKSNKQ